MKYLIRSGLAIAIAASFLFSAQTAGAQDSQPTLEEITNNAAQVLGLGGLTPEGLWQTDSGDSRYLVDLCGDGTQLCAELVWIRPRDRNKHNMRFMNKFVAFEADRTRPAQWKGDVNIFGNIYDGTVNILTYDRVQVTGCLFVLCESFELLRKRHADGTRYIRPEAPSGA